MAKQVPHLGEVALLERVPHAVDLLLDLTVRGEPRHGALGALGHGVLGAGDDRPRASGSGSECTTVRWRVAR